MVNLFFDPKTHKPLNLKSWQFHMCGSRYFRQGGGGGGGGGPGQSDKKSYDSLFFFFVFFSPQLFFTEVKWLISKKSIIFQGSRGGPTFSRGGPTFSRGVQLFPGGVQLLVPYRNPYNLWFSRGGGGGSGPPVPPSGSALVSLPASIWNQDNSIREKLVLPENLWAAEDQMSQPKKCRLAKASISSDFFFRE